MECFERITGLKPATLRYDDITPSTEIQNQNILSLFSCCILVSSAIIFSHCMAIGT